MTPDPDARYWPTPAAYRLPPNLDPEQPMQLDTTTNTTPPATSTDDGGDDDDRSVRISVDFHDGTRILDAGVALFGDQIDDPEEFASALLGAALALARLRGPDYGWATAARFIAYDGAGR